MRNLSESKIDELYEVYMAKCESIENRYGGSAGEKSLSRLDFETALDIYRENDTNKQSAKRIAEDMARDTMAGFSKKQQRRMAGEGHGFNRFDPEQVNRARDLLSKDYQAARKRYKELGYTDKNAKAKAKEEVYDEYFGYA